MKHPRKRDGRLIMEGLAYGVVSFLAIGQQSPNYLLISSWVAFLVYLVARFLEYSGSGKNACLAGIARLAWVIGWVLIIALAAISCVGAAQR